MKRKVTGDANTATPVQVKVNKDGEKVDFEPMVGEVNTVKFYPGGTAVDKATASEKDVFEQACASGDIDRVIRWERETVQGARFTEGLKKRCLQTLLKESSTESRKRAETAEEQEVVQLEIAVQPEIGHVTVDEVVWPTIDGAAEAAGRKLESSPNDKDDATLSSNTGPAATPPVPAANSMSESCDDLSVYELTVAKAPAALYTDGHCEHPDRSALELDVTGALLALSATGRSDQDDLINFELEDDEARDRMTPEQIMAALYAHRG